MINTKKVKGRRTLHFENLDEMLAEAERLVRGDVRMLGNWSLAQVLMHLAMTHHFSIDGYPWLAPRFVRGLVKLLFKNRLLRKGFPPSGNSLPKNATPPTPEDPGPEEALTALRDATQRVRTESKRSTHPIFGELSLDDWEKLYLRHAELHLSFAVPTSES